MAIAIGDIHGCLEQLKQLIDKLPKDKQLVFLGDYIDRGPDSAGVISFLRALSTERDCVFLSGNHEDMMLSNQDLWLINGGYQALLSYGLHAIPSGTLFLGTDLEFFESLKLYRR
jgi:serine/threonine protein phosphatase 1